MAIAADPEGDGPAVTPAGGEGKNGEKLSGKRKKKDFHPKNNPPGKFIRQKKQIKTARIGILG